MKRVYAAIAIALTLMTQRAAIADTPPYESYTYNHHGEAVVSANGYEPVCALTGDMLGLSAFSNLSDVYVYGDRIYLLDTNNQRIIVTDAQMNLINVISGFTWQGGIYELSGAQGLFVRDDDEIYIADTDNGRVVVMDGAGQVLRAYSKPQSEQLASVNSYLPISVAVDRMGTIYVVSKGVSFGALMLTQSNEFLGFFGANNTHVTLKMLMDRFWRNFSGEKAREFTAKYIPAELTALAMDNDNFIYTCTSTMEDRVNLIRKVNPYGKNIMEVKALKSYQGGFGDAQVYHNRLLITTQFIDLAVSDTGMIAALDFTTGRVFQYDKDANMMFAYAGNGSRFGLFRNPAAIAFIGRDVLVADRGGNCLVRFAPTLYGETLMAAQESFSSGQYERAEVLWRQVLRFNANYDRAYVGLGKTYLEQGEFKQAMETIRKSGGSRYWYNEAFEGYRKQVLRRYFWIAFAVLGAGLLYAMRRRIPVLARLITLVRVKWRTPYLKDAWLVRVALHPADGYEELYYRNAGRAGVATLMVLAYYVATIAQRQYTQFKFNPSAPEDINILFLFVQTVLVCGLFTVINWALTTLFDGKGRVREIWVAIGYAILPLVVCTLINIGLSFVLSLDESAFMTIITLIGGGWSLFLLIRSLSACHQYSTGQTLLSILFSVLGIFVVAFIFVLFLSLSQQIIGFVMTMIKETMLR